MMERAKDNQDRYRRLQGVEREVQTLLGGQERELLELGAPGRLLVTGELEEVLPLEDAGALEAARPIGPDGKRRLDQAKLEALEDAMVHSLIGGPPVSLVVLGGEHDLADNVRRLAPNTEYIRVTTHGYGKIGP